eukprot:4466120-Pleurochrysis_carterae.AAC.1
MSTAAISAGIGDSSVEHTFTGSHGHGDSLENTLGGGESRDQPQEAWTCTCCSSPAAASAEVQVAADRGSNSIAAGAASATPSPA